MSLARLEMKGMETDRVDAPTIFRIAGFNTEKSQWISGLNNIFYMVSTIHNRTSISHTDGAIVFNAYLRLHS